MNTLVIGYGITGKSTADFLIKYGNKVYIYDDSEDVINSLPERFMFHDGSVIPDLAVKSPGVSNDHKVVIALKAAGVEIISEMELAARYLENEKVVAVTGTNGKSTTVSLIAEIFKKAGKNVFLCGNIGDPVVGGIGKGHDVLVVELSSYQIEGLESLHPDVCAILNVSPDHLDRYSSYEEYLMTKVKLAKLTKKDGLVVLNGSDEPLMAATGTLDVNKAYFSSSDSGNIAFRNGSIYFGNSEIIIEETNLTGIHNVENIMASILCAGYFDINENDIADAVYTFKGLQHRTELVDTFNGVSFVNDSKGTNVGAVEKSLAGFNDKSVVLILGGVDKGGSYEPLVKLVKNKCNALVLIGSSAKIIRTAFEGVVPIEEADSMMLAVEKSYDLAQGSGTVLLSPACSSFDWYANFKERGKDFVKCVSKLKEIKRQ